MDFPTTVCSMCGDVGFPEKLFRCTFCRNRFQHSYCSNYYRQDGEAIELCDWCQSEQSKSSSSTSTRHFGVGLSPSPSSSTKKSTTTGQKVVIKQISTDHGNNNNGEQRNNSKDHVSGTPSPRPATRRYKLLKDVMC